MARTATGGYQFGGEADRIMIAKDLQSAEGKQETFTGQARGWVQWKGTDVCIDVHCKCGKISHYDGEYMYNIKCPYCERVYFANPHIQLIEVAEYDESSLKVAIKLSPFLTSPP